MGEALERIVPSCVEALGNYQQADMDGIMVLVSRQAIHETINAYWARVETCEELEANLAEQIEWVKSLADDLIAAEGREARLKEKLSKAVWALDKIKRIDNLVGVFAACERTLAELTGGKDE